MLREKKANKKIALNLPKKMKWNLRDDHINPLIVPCVDSPYLIEDDEMEIQTSTAAIAFYGLICNPIWEPS